MRSAKRALPALVMVTGTLAITACGTIHASGTSAAAPGATSTQAYAGMVEAYAVPNANPRLDGAVDAQLVTNGAVSGRSSFGTATDVWQLHPTSPQPVNCACLIAYQSDLGRSEFIRLPTLATAGWQVALPGSAQQSTALQFGSTLLAQSGTSVAQASLAASSPQKMTPARAYRLPVISPDPVAGVFPRGYKGLYSGVGVGQVSAMIRASGGDIIALASTGRGAAVTDLSSGRSQPLAGYGQLGAAALAPDGQIYALAWRDFEPGFTSRSCGSARARWLSPGSTTPASSPGNSGTRRSCQRAAATQSSACFTVTRRASRQSCGRWPARQCAAWRRWPPNIALDASVIGNIVYLFGGPAKNQVSRLAISTGVLSRDVASLRTPSNSWVLAVSAA